MQLLQLELPQLLRKKQKLVLVKALKMSKKLKQRLSQTLLLHPLMKLQWQCMPLWVNPAYLAKQFQVNLMTLRWTPELMKLF